MRTLLILFTSLLLVTPAIAKRGDKKHGKTKPETGPAAEWQLPETVVCEATPCSRALFLRSNFTFIDLEAGFQAGMLDAAAADLEPDGTIRFDFPFPVTYLWLGVAEWVADSQGDGLAFGDAISGVEVSTDGESWFTVNSFTPDPEVQNRLVYYTLGGSVSNAAYSLHTAVVEVPASDTIRVRGLPNASWQEAGFVDVVGVMGR
jgi:hypothetical protein